MPCSHSGDSDTHCNDMKLEGLKGKELHGNEPRGIYHAFLNAAKEVALLLLLVWTVLNEMQVPLKHNIFALATIAGGWVIWKGCKSAYLSWNQLGYLHRVMMQEKKDIETNRDKIRSELKEMYRSKGLEGNLLEDVLDVYMSDDDRLLKIMIEEEFGLTLEAYDHPLKIGVAACLGAFISAVILLFASAFYPQLGLVVSSFILLGLTEGTQAYFNGRQVIASAIWTMAIGVISVGLSHFLIIWIQSFRLLP